MAAATLKIFIGQSVTTQYADLKSAGVLKVKITKTIETSQKYILS